MTKATLFVANDPISLQEFRHDWKRHYHPKSGKNQALLHTRIDIGSGFGDDYYLGYFYRYNIHIQSRRDFADLYYRVKNKLNLERGRDYDLGLKIDGIKESGIIFARQDRLFETQERYLQIGYDGYISYAFDMQYGSISGNALADGEKSYDINVYSSYHYTHNYLYKLAVNRTYGVGIGGGVALSYHDSIYRFDAKLIISDIFSRVYWKDLPYSRVTIGTHNKSYDKEGYVKYDPSISGLEKSDDYTQYIRPKYALSVSQQVTNSLSVKYGLQHAYATEFPWVSLQKDISEKQTILCSYEFRFHTVEFGYRYHHLEMSVASDRLDAPSAGSLQLKYRHQF